MTFILTFIVPEVLRKGLLTDDLPLSDLFSFIYTIPSRRESQSPHVMNRIFGRSKNQAPPNLSECVGNVSCLANIAVSCALEQCVLASCILRAMAAADRNDAHLYRSMRGPSPSIRRSLELTPSLSSTRTR